MCNPLLVVAGGAMVAGGGYTAYNQYKEGVAADKYYQYQADQSSEEAALALKQGDKQSNLIQDSAKVQGRDLKIDQAESNASQKATMSAMGISGVTAEDIVNNTATKQQMDEALLRYNADVKSWEVQTDAKNKNWAALVQADQLRYAGKNARSAGKRQAVGTLLGTAASVASLAALGGGGAAKHGFSTSGKSVAGRGFGAF